MADHHNPEFKTAQEAGLGRRLVVVEQVVVQAIDRQPVGFDHVSSSPLSVSDEQVYVRNTKVGEKWEKLDTGWVNRAEVILVRNDEGRFLRVPTPEEKEIMAVRILRVGISVAAGVVEAFAVVKPQQELRFCPSYYTDRYYIQSCFDVIRYTVIAIPE